MVVYRFHNFCKGCILFFVFVFVFGVVLVFLQLV